MSCILCGVETKAAINALCGNCISEHSNLMNSLELKIGGKGRSFYYGGDFDFWG